MAEKLDGKVCLVTGACALVLAQAASAQPALSVPVGSVGVAYLETEQTLTVVFPASAAKGLADAFAGKAREQTAPVAVGGDLVFFDAQGPLGRVTATGPASAKFWCENDGGVQFRPELTVKLAPGALKRKLSPVARLQKLAAFVAVVPHEVKAKFKLETIAWRTTSDERALDGDFDGDKKPEAVIYVAPDEAHNCDGKPKNDLRVTLLAGDHWDELRCCGP